MHNKKNINSITFVIGSLDLGGAQRVLVNLANYFSSNGMKVNIIYSMEFKNKPAYKVSENINFYKVPSNIKLNVKGFVNGKINNFLILKHLRTKFKELDSDIIISFLDKTNVRCIIANFMLKTPLVISERISYDFLQSKSWRFLRKLFYPFSDGMVVLSKYDFNKYDFVKNKKIIFNPLNIDETLKVKFEKKEKIILAAGRLEKQKGFDRLIKAISKFNTKEWKVFILGEGSERGPLESLISKYNLGKQVFLLGNKDDIYEYYNRASIFVLSSRYEGFPNVLAEAMAYGCSCIAFDCKTGPSDIIEDNVNGVLVPDGKIDLLAKGIEKVLNDVELRKQFFVKALQIREELQLEKIVKEWNEYFETINKKYS